MAQVLHTIETIGDSTIVNRVFRGVVSSEDIMDSFVYIIKNNMIGDRCKGILTDLRGVDLKLDMNSFKKLVIYIKSSHELVGLKIAVIVDTSGNIVFPMMASNDPGMIVQPFSTAEAAKEWLLQ